MKTHDIKCAAEGWSYLVDGVRVASYPSWFMALNAARMAAEKGVGAFTVNGRMVDAPFVRRAEAILELARRLKLIAAEERTIQ